jgi:hypothetical protein
VNTEKVIVGVSNRHTDLGQERSRSLGRTDALVSGGADLVLVT